MSPTLHHIRLTSLLTLLLLMLTVTAARGEKTLRGKLRTNPEMVKKTTNEIKSAFDTVKVTSQADIRLSGYDKPLNSRKESLFVTNQLPRDIIAVEFLINYTDMTGRQLHEATYVVYADIPAGATRRVDFPSWDKQNSFYYHKSRRPRSSNVTPFKVGCTVTAYVWMPPADSIPVKNFPSSP